KALLDSNRRDLRTVDQALRLFPRQTSSPGNGSGGGRQQGLPRPGLNANKPYDSWPRTFHDRRQEDSLPQTRLPSRPRALETDDAGETPGAIGVTLAPRP